MKDSGNGNTKDGEDTYTTPLSKPANLEERGGVIKRDGFPLLGNLHGPRLLKLMALDPLYGAELPLKNIPSAPLLQEHMDQEGNDLKGFDNPWRGIALPWLHGMGVTIQTAVLLGSGLATIKVLLNAGLATLGLVVVPMKLGDELLYPRTSQYAKYGWDTFKRSISFSNWWYKLTSTVEKVGVPQTKAIQYKKELEKAKAKSVLIRLKMSPDSTLLSGRMFSAVKPPPINLSYSEIAKAHTLTIFKKLRDWYSETFMKQIEAQYRSASGIPDRKSLRISDRLWILKKTLRTHIKLTAIPTLGLIPKLYFFHIKTALLYVTWTYFLYAFHMWVIRGTIYKLDDRGFRRPKNYIDKHKGTFQLFICYTTMYHVLFLTGRIKGNPTVHFRDALPLKKLPIALLLFFTLGHILDTYHKTRERDVPFEEYIWNRGFMRQLIEPEFNNNRVFGMLTSPAFWRELKEIANSNIKKIKEISINTKNLRKQGLYPPPGETFEDWASERPRRTYSQTVQLALPYDPVLQQLSNTDQIPENDENILVFVQKGDTTALSPIPKELRGGLNAFKGGLGAISEENVNKRQL